MVQVFWDFVLLASKVLLILKDVMQGLFDPEDEHTTIFGNMITTYQLTWCNMM